MLFIQTPPHREQTEHERAAFVTVYLSRAVHICTIYVNSYCNIKTVGLDIKLHLKEQKLNVIIAVFWLSNATKKKIKIRNCSNGWLFLGMVANME